MSGLFGAAKPAGTTGGLFGQPAQNQQTPTGGGLFGGQNTAAAGGGGGLFGQPAQQQQNQPTGGGGLFGQSTQQQTQGATGGGGLFGQPTQQQNQGGNTTGGLFGGGAANTGGGGLFGQSTNQQNTATGGGLFGANNQQQQQQQQQGTATGGLFGRPATQNQGPGLSLGGNSLLGGANNNTGLGGSLFGQTTNQQPAQQQQQQQQQQQPNAAQPQGPAGAYFDDLFAKSQKAGDGAKTNMEDLPTLELGLGDLRHRLRKLQSKPNEKPLDGKAHYLLAASGVDPSTAVKDLGMLDVQNGRGDRSTNGYAPAEVDVETYLSNLQTKTTLDMIADGLERSVRDFDAFLEDNVEIEWEAQRKRIYQHFGIKPREESAAGGRESQSAFGRSRRSRSQHGGAASRTNKTSIFGKSSMYKSVIGTPSQIGAHQSEFSDIGRSTENGGNAGRSTEDRGMRERQAKLAEKVRGLNHARLLERPFPILFELAEVESKSQETHASHVVEAYRAVMEIVGEDPSAETTINGATAKERQYAKMYLNDNPNSPEAIDMRKRIIQGSNQYLENAFLREVEALIAKYPHEARLGGLPDITSKIKAYVRLRSARKDLVPDNTELQQVQGDYVWAIVFYLLRSGHVHEAATYVNDNSNHFRGIDRTFSTYLNNYAATPERRITNRKLLDRCTNEYIQRSRNAPENSVDPFRMACYKIIGRIELSNRNLEGLQTDINDWVWLQFNLAREGDRTVEMAGESYGLAELQNSTKEIGAKHFPKAPSDDNGGAFGMFFYLQILSGLFEDAVAYLYQFSYVDAVHFGLALEYYGLLRPSDPMSGSNDLRNYSTKNLPQINFGRMIGYYTRDFRAADVVSAVDYLSLICLNQDLGGEAGGRQSALCHEALRELVLETREFSRLIGDIRPDGRRIRGTIEERSSLIGLGNVDLVNTITLQAASFADENGRTTDSVLLYHLAGEYDTVISIVSRALSEAVSLEIGEDPMRLKPVKPRETGKAAEAKKDTTLSLAAIDGPVELAKTMMGMYEKDAMFYRQIQEANRTACSVLLEMSEIKGLVSAGQWAPCIDVR